MDNEFKLYSRIEDHETVLECWGASTKHPDSVFYFSDFKKTHWFDEKDQILPWILECASKMMWPIHAYQLASWGCELYQARWKYPFYG